MSRFMAWVASPFWLPASTPCWPQSSGTVLAKVTIRCRTEILLSNAGFSAAGSRDQLDAVGGEQLVVAERRRYRACVRIVFEPGLDVVQAVAARLEAVDA